MESRNQKKKWLPLRVACVYVLIGMLWVLSDVWLDTLLSDRIIYLSVMWVLFVFLSGLALYFGVSYFSEKTNHANREWTELIRKNHQLAAITDGLKCGVLIMDPHQPDQPIIYTNPAFTELTGYTSEEAVGRNCSLLHGKDTNPKVIEQCKTAIKNGKTATIEILNYRKDGSSFWNEVSLHPIYDENRNIIYVLNLQIDITKRKIAERRLQESEQHYKSLFRHNPEIVCACDLTGKVTKVNPAVEKIVGYRPDEVIGQDHRDFIDKERWEGARSFFWKVLKGRPQHGQFQVQHKDGHSVDLEAAVMPIVVDGRIVGMYTIAKDVTNYNKAEEMLRKAEKLNVVGELAAGIAHEIRNPLTSLKGFVQLLRPSLTKKKAYTDVMLSELERIEQIVTELLLLAKPQTVQFEERNLRELLEHVRTLLGTKAIMSNIEILLDYQCDATDIYCEENQLKQVLINLVKNAIEAMPSGGKIKINAENGHDESVCIRVVDQGCGIPEDSLPKLGEPFYTTKEQGTGLGLMISWKIIREHGGSMAFKSRENEGTTVEINLPVSAKKLKEAERKYQVAR